MKPFLSIIIPAFNAAQSLDACLPAVYSSSYTNYAVIVVDDHSTDQSRSIVETYPCLLIALDQNRGSSNAKNCGQARSKGVIDVLIDADVEILNTTLGLIAQRFEEDASLTAVTGMLALDYPHPNFSSQYKNLYMHYSF